MEGYQSFATNFDPLSMANQTSSVILFTVALDISPSIENFEGIMNDVAREVFMKELKNSHRKADIAIQCITFNEEVKFKSGFQPILNMQDDYLFVKGCGRATALYEAVEKALESTMKYREDLEDQGVDVRSNICIITDGADNVSNYQVTGRIKDLLSKIRQNEAWANSFTITVIGVGVERIFRSACVEMGLDPDKVLVTINGSAEEIRKQMGVVSQSVSQSNAGTAITF